MAIVVAINTKMTSEEILNKVQEQEAGGEIVVIIPSQHATMVVVKEVESGLNESFKAVRASYGGRQTTFSVRK